MQPSGDMEPRPSDADRLNSPPAVRPLGREVPGPGRQVYAAGVLALTEPGPAAAGIAITDERGRVLAHRAHYLGNASRAEANARAFLAAVRLVATADLTGPTFRVDDAALVNAVTGKTPAPASIAAVVTQIREALERLPGSRVLSVSTGSNVARAVALAPLSEWLPERTRRAEGLRVRSLADGIFEVASERLPDVVYRVSLREPHDGDGDLVLCECPDFVHRGLPCKHILAVAREAGALNRLFYPDAGDADSGEQRRTA